MQDLVVERCDILCGFVLAGGLSLEFPSVLYMDQLVRFNCSVDGTSAGGNFTWSRDNIALLGGSSGQLETVVRADWNGSTLTCMEEGGSCASQDLTVYSKFGLGSSLCGRIQISECVQI